MSDFEPKMPSNAARAKSVGYTVWQDTPEYGGNSYRFTAPGGDYDSQKFHTAKRAWEMAGDHFIRNRT